MCFRPPTIEGGEIKCPMCGGMAPMDAEVCPHCGASSAATTVAPPPPVPGGMKKPGVPRAVKVPGAPKAPGAPK